MNSFPLGMGEETGAQDFPKQTKVSTGIWIARWFQHFFLQEHLR